MNQLGVAVSAALVAVALAAASGCGGSDEESAGDTETTTTTTVPAGTALKGSVGPGFEISLMTEDGTPITTLAPGTYDLEVDDVSSIHNFRLSGPGVSISTSVGEEGTEAFHVELQPGRYEFVCDPHASTMNGSFEVSG